MKKIMSIFVVLVMCVTSVFADKKYDSIGFHFSIPVTLEETTSSGVKTESSMNSIGFGIHGLTMFTDVVGMYVNMDFFFPQKLTLKQTYRGMSQSIDISRSDYDSIWGMSALFAPAFKLVWNEKNLFTISPGIHYQLLYADAYYTSVVYMFGLGANLQDSVFFSKNGYFTFGCDIAYDFIGISKTNNPSVSKSDSGFGYDFTFVPRVGIGFRL